MNNEETKEKKTKNTMGDWDMEGISERNLTEKQWNNK